MSHKYCINQFLNFDLKKRKSVKYAFVFHIPYHPHHNYFGKFHVFGNFDC